ncbi:TIGR03899 family protein [Alteromonas sp.]|nr:TIGR03899 family protein [Alteromonas sp.]
MKITSDISTNTVSKPKNENQVPKKESDETTNTATQKAPSTVHLQQKILSWFSRVGISPSMSSPDPKRQQQVLARRKQILEAQKASNLQSILNIALNVAISESEKETIDPDWFFAFSSMAEEIHSPAMQELWGKIFAVEVSKPGSFSLRSLQILKSITHRDAKIFSRAVSIASRSHRDSVPRILVGFHRRKGLFSLFKRRSPEQLSLSHFGLSFPDLLALQDMKLIYASEIESGEYVEGQQTKWRCGSEHFSLASKTTGVALIYYKFTAAGSELAKLVGRSDNAHYLTMLHQVLGEAFVVS